MKQDNRKTAISASISMNILLIEKYELFNNPRESVYLQINEGGREKYDRLQLLLFDKAVIYK